jgi:hypothetical protein
MIYEVEKCSGWIINRGRENGTEWNGRGRDPSDAAEVTLPSDMRARRGRNGRTVENKPAAQKNRFHLLIRVCIQIPLHQHPNHHRTSKSQPLAACYVFPSNRVNVWKEARILRFWWF